MRVMLASVLLLVLGAGRARAAYQVVTLDGRTLEATSIGFSRDAALLVTRQGPQKLPLAAVDFYETFMANIGSGATNVVAFRTGSLLRFERVDLKPGVVHVTVADGSEFDVTESLIDFERSVREGALVRVPEGAGGAAAVSKSVQGSAPVAGEDEMAVVDEELPQPTPTSATTSRAGSARRPPLGADRGRRIPALAGRADRAGIGSDAGQQDFEPQPQGAVPDESSNEQPAEELDKGQDGSDTEVPFGGQTGQTVVEVYSDFTGDLTGLQVRLSYPARSLRIVGQPAFTGFAAAFNPQMGSQPGLINIGGIVAPDSPVSAIPGDVMRTAFSWSGRAPRPDEFSLSVTATDGNGVPIPGFPARLNVR